MALDRQPTLIGPTLTLRPLTAADRDDLREAASDPLIWAQHPSNRHERGEFDAFFDQALRSGGALVALTSDGEVVGTSRYQPAAQDDASVEIGWSFLIRACWGGPTNREMKTLMIDHAFTTVDRVVFRVAPDNLRSQKAVEKLGADRLPDADASGSVTYVLTRARWQGATPQPS